jgi:hypothetical protein
MDDDCDLEQEIETPECPLCAGPSGALGLLGTLLWCCCRNCGMQFAVKLEDLADGPCGPSRVA